jgi:hypothetical protein
VRGNIQMQLDIVLQAVLAVVFIQNHMEEVGVVKNKFFLLFQTGESLSGYNNRMKIEVRE